MKFYEFSNVFDPKDKSPRRVSKSTGVWLYAALNAAGPGQPKGAAKQRDFGLLKADAGTTVMTIGIGLPPWLTGPMAASALKAM